MILDGHYDPPATTQFAYFGAPASSISVIDDVTAASASLGYDVVRAHGFDHFETYASGASGRFAVQSVHTPQL